MIDGAGVTCSGAKYANGAVSVWLSRVVSVIVASPAVPAGVVTSNVVDETCATAAAGRTVSPWVKVTRAPGRKPTPSTTRKVPPTALLRVGKTEVMLGRGIS